MINNPLRIGNFTSSEIVALTATGKQQEGFGIAAITYILETNMERLLGCSIDSEIDAKPTSWGNLLEPRVHDILPTSYSYSSKQTDVHPDFPYWVGSKDGINNAGQPAVTDIKCPFTKKSFLQLALPSYFGKTGIEAMLAICDGFTQDGFEYPAHPQGKKYYWQLVSNACINKTTHAELIAYMPLQSELLEIKKMADGNSSVYWMNFIEDGAIPCIPDNGNFKNMYIIRFEVPQADKDLLTACVAKGGKLLVNPVAEQLKTAA